MTNPLIEKYNELYNPKPPEPPKDPYRHLRYEDRKLIDELERLIEGIKTGKASFHACEVKDNYRRANNIPMFFNGDIDYNSYMNSSYMKYDEGQMITIQVFRSYE